MASDILVTTADGTLRGRRVGKLRAWRGIPYARPPVGTLRLTRPQPVTPWTGERDATRFGDASVQHKKGLLLAPGKYQPSSEDCLTLNVLAPANTGNTPRPVMVFIHGGANTIGTSATGLYSGVSLVERGDVVYVSINYRLGALGYLDFTPFSTSERVFDSNLGLRDQVAALRWVQRNIAAFGGDPEKVTIFGESAGATAVTTLMATPAAKGLFAGAIAESSAPDLVSSTQRSHAWGARFVEILNSGLPPREGPDLGDSRRIGQSRKQTGRRGTREHTWTASLRTGRRRRLPAALPLGRIQRRIGTPGADDHRHQQTGGDAVPEGARRTSDQPVAHRHHVCPHRSRGREAHPRDLSRLPGRAVRDRRRRRRHVLAPVRGVDASARTIGADVRLPIRLRGRR